MAITVTPGTPVGATGGVNVTSIDVTAPTLGTNDLHVIAVSLTASTPTVTTPAGYSVLGPRTQTTSGGSSSTTTNVYVFYRLGTATSGTITLTAGAAGRLAAVPATFSGVDSTTPVQASSVSGTYLTAPTLTATSTSTHWLVAYGVREGTGAVGTPNTITVTPAAGFTEIGDVSSTVANNTQEVAAELAYKTVSSGATGTAVATTDANASFVAGVIDLLLNASSSSSTAPDAPSITTTAGNTTVDVNWTAPANGGSVITSYNLQRTTTSGSGYTDVPSTNGILSSATTYHDTGRTNGTTYYYRLKATNAIGASAYSSESAVTPTTSGGAGTGQIGVYQSIPGLLALWPLDSTYQLQDVIGGRNLINHGTVTFGSTGATFNGTNYLEAAANNTVFNWGNQTKNGWSMMCQRSVSNWAVGTRDPGGSGYCHYMGVGSSFTNTITTFRHYFDPDQSGQGRPRRESGYAFNPTDEYGNGHLGAGSFWQENDPTSTFVFKCLTINTSYAGESVTFPGQTKIYKNGVLKDTDTFYGAGTYKIYEHPTNSAPFRIGQVHDGSGFLGTIKMAAIYDHELTQAEVTTLNNSTGLAIGTAGGGSQNTVPGAPINVAANRNSTDQSLGTVSWAAPTDNGGTAVTGYVVSWAGGTTTFTSSTLGTGASPYSLTGLPSQVTTVTVQAVNAVGPGAGASATLPVASSAALPLAGTLSDNFNGAIDGTRHFDTGVTQTNGELEWSIVDATHRATYVRANMTGQRFFMKVVPGTTLNDVVALLVRNTADATQQFRIAIQNTATGYVLSARDAQTGTAVVSTRVYSPMADLYLSISESAGTVLMQSSPDGTNWTTISHAAMTTPTWFGDVLIGVEAYNNVTV